MSRFVNRFTLDIIVLGKRRSVMGYSFDMRLRKNNFMVIFFPRYTGHEFCGIAGDKKGPFASCHPRVDIKQFTYDCLYDVCVNEGRQDALCEALSSYNAKCQKAGVTVSPWREVANCCKF